MIKSHPGIDSVYRLWVRVHTQTWLIIRIKPGLIYPSAITDIKIWPRNTSKETSRSPVFPHLKHERPLPVLASVFACPGCMSRVWQHHRRVNMSPFVVYTIDRGVPQDTLFKSDSCLLPGTFQSVALPLLPAGVQDVHRNARPSGRMEPLEQMERCRKLKVTDVCQGGWHWRRPRRVVILITLKLVACVACFKDTVVVLQLIRWLQI